MALSPGPHGTKPRHPGLIPKPQCCGNKNPGKEFLNAMPKEEHQAFHWSCQHLQIGLQYVNERCSNWWEETLNHWDCFNLHFNPQSLTLCKQWVKPVTPTPTVSDTLHVNLSHCHHINLYILIAGQEALAEADYWQRPPDGFSRACPLFPVKNCIGQPRLWRNSCCFQMLLLLWNWKCGANAAGAKRINPSSCVRMVLQKMFYMFLVMVKITVRTMSWPK